MVAAAAAPTARSAAGLGWLLFFPNMFLAGIYFPTEEMSSTMRQIGNFTPLGSALHAVPNSSMGLDPRLEYLGIMAAYAVIAGVLAAPLLPLGTSVGKGMTVTVRTPDSGFESIEHRYERLERFLPFLLLAVPLIPYVLSQSPTAGAVGITAGVAVAAGAWIMWMIHPASWLDGAPVADAGLLHRPARVHRRAHHPQSLVRVLHLARLPARHPVS